jgi:hypothetical protein
MRRRRRKIQTCEGGKEEMEEERKDERKESAKGQLPLSK